MKRLISLLPIVLAFAVARPALAGTSTGTGRGTVDRGGSVEVGVIVSTPGGSVVDLPNGHTPWLTWELTGIGHATPGDLTALCPTPQDSQHPGLGVLWRLVGRDHADKVVFDKVICVPHVDPSAPSSPPPVPQLPTIEDAWRRAHLPRPLIGLDPTTRGITGLDTRIWTESGATVSIRATVGGYTITGTATVTGYRVRIDDDPVVTSELSGDSANPIAHHVFERKGEHIVSVGVVWHGTATLTGPDLPNPVRSSIGDAVMTATRAYPVSEVRAVLQP